MTNLTPAQRDELRSRCDQPLLCVTAEEMLALLADVAALDRLRHLVRALLAETRESVNLIKFMHDCLTKPKTHKYEYPKQTREHVGRLNRIAPPVEGCHHSRRMSNCEQCQSSAAEYELLRWLGSPEASKLLKAAALKDQTP